MSIRGQWLLAVLVSLVVIALFVGAVEVAGWYGGRPLVNNPRLQCPHGTQRVHEACLPTRVPR